MHSLVHDLSCSCSCSRSPRETGREAAVPPAASRTGVWQKEVGADSPDIETQRPRSLSVNPRGGGGAEMDAVACGWVRGHALRAFGGGCWGRSDPSDKKASSDSQPRSQAETKRPEARQRPRGMPRRRRYKESRLSKFHTRITPLGPRPRQQAASRLHNGQ